MSGQAKKIQKQIQQKATQAGSGNSIDSRNRYFSYAEVDAIVARRDQLHAQTITDDLVPLMMEVLAIENFLKDILIDAALYRGEELRLRVNEERMSVLSGILTRLLVVADRTNAPTDGPVQRVANHQEAMRKLVNEYDDGEALRNLAKAEGGSVAGAAEWREMIKLAGSEKGKNDWSIALAQKIAHFVDDDHKDVTEAARLAVDHFLAIPVDYTRLDTTEQRARSKIAKWPVNKRIDNARGHFYAWRNEIRPSA